MIIGVASLPRLLDDLGLDQLLVPAMDLGLGPALGSRLVVPVVAIIKTLILEELQENTIVVETRMPHNNSPYII